MMGLVTYSAIFWVGFDWFSSGYPTGGSPPPPCDHSVLVCLGTPSTNVHLSGLRRLMEEIPVAESSSSSRAMYNIAIGHSMMRRHDRTNFLSYYNGEFRMVETFRAGRSSGTPNRSCLQDFLDLATRALHQ